jgi:hypothetical protein
MLSEYAEIWSVKIYSCSVWNSLDYVYDYLKYFYYKVVRHKTKHVTECRGRVVTTPASYSGGPGLKSQPEDQLYWLTFL